MQAGSYTGSFLSFWVEPGGTKIVNVLEPVTSLTCAPGGNWNDVLLVTAVPIKADGSFSVRTSQTGVFKNQPATYIYTFSGRFQAATTTTPAGAAGSYREDIVVSGGIQHCTTNPQTWTASRYAQPVPTTALVTPGSYRGLSLSFTVAGRQVANVSESVTTLGCLPSYNANDHLQISSIPIKPDGSFSATVSTTGVYQNVPAKFTDTFEGYFEGPTLSGSTVAGFYREDIKPSSGSTTMCTTNDQPWHANLGAA